MLPNNRPLALSIVLFFCACVCACVLCLRDAQISLMQGRVDNVKGAHTQTQDNLTVTQQKLIDSEKQLMVKKTN
jgi:uncharacterized Fe-S radical SAM superfamily protein PflX